MTDEANTLYIEIGKEYYSHIESLKQGMIDYQFNFTHLLISPEYYVKLMSAPEIQTYAYFGNPTVLFKGIELIPSPLVDKWKWVCDMK